MMPNRCLLSFVVLALGTLSAGAQQNSTKNTCPISYDHLNMPYKHPGGVSVPMVELSFTNQTQKKIDRAKFGLIVLDQTGGVIPYDKLLTFSAGADPGKVVSAEWALEMDKVTMYRNGEILYLQNVHFADGTTWQDDGNQRCKDEINYGPK
jgi:hypothetical protein